MLESPRSRAGCDTSWSVTRNPCIASACAPADMEFWLSLDIDLLFLTNDVACLKKAAADTLEEARKLIVARSAGILS